MAKACLNFVRDENLFDACAEKSVWVHRHPTKMGHKRAFEVRHGYTTRKAELLNYMYTKAGIPFKASF